jgi:hypothetical protein
MVEQVLATSRWPACHQLGDAKPDAEPAEPLRHRLGDVAPVEDLMPVSHGGTPYGVRTTLMQPSSLSRNVSYISGPS